MDLLDRLLAHDAWTTGRLLDCSRGLDPAALDQRMDLGPGSIRATLVHVIRNMEVWTDLMADRPLREAGSDDLEALASRLERAAADLASLARDVGARDAWDETWLDRLDDPPREKTYGGAIGHVLTHSMHHRAQLIHMLKRAGAQDVPEGDLLSWERTTT